MYKDMHIEYTTKFSFNWLTVAGINMLTAFSSV